MSDAEDDLIESDEASPTMSRLRQRLGVLVPPRVGRRFLGGVTVTALALGLVAGYLVGQSPENQEADVASRSSAPGDLNNIPFVPEGTPLDEGVPFTLHGGLLTLEDLTALGEQPRPRGTGLNAASGLAGLCAGADPATVNGALSAVSFDLADALLRELISPDLDVLAASTLRGEVQLAQNCAASDDLTAQTEGVLDGIGDEYAAFTVRRTDPASGAVTTSYVILVRVGGQLIEVSLTPGDVTDVPDGLTRALRIAEAAVTRVRTG